MAAVIENNTEVHSPNITSLLPGKIPAWPRESSNGIVCLTLRQELEDVRLFWQRLWEQSDPDGIFLSPEWLLTWWDQFGKGRKLCVLVVLKENHVVGLAPWFLDVRLGYRRLRTLGDGYIDYEGVLMGKGNEQWVSATLQQWLLDHPLFEEAIFDRQLLEPLALESNKWADSSLAYHSQSTNVAPLTDLSEGWNVFIQKVDMKFRKDTERQFRRLEAQGTLRLDQVKSLEELQARFALFQTWKGSRYRTRYFRRSTSVFGSEGFWGIPEVAHYYFTVAEQLLSRGCLAFSALDLDGEMVSAIYGMQKDGRFFYFAPAFNPDYHSFSIGRIHLWLLMQDLCMRGITSFDFLIGNEEYKQKWVPTNRPLTKVHIKRMGLVSFCKGIPAKSVEFLSRQNWIAEPYVKLKGICQ